MFCACYKVQSRGNNIESCTKDLDVHPTLLLNIPKFGIHTIYIVIMLGSFLNYDMYEVVWLSCRLNVAYDSDIIQRHIHVLSV